MTPPTSENSGYPAISSIALDLSKLVGHHITLYTEQIPGKKLQTRVVAANDKQISVDSSGESGLINNLVNQQKVVLQFVHKGQEISVKATLIRSLGGRCHCILEEQVTPLAKRQYCRVELVKPIKLAPFPTASHNKSNLSALHWMATDSVNLSSGGLLVIVPSYLHSGIHMLLNVDWEEFEFPALVMGQVRHCFQGATGQFKIGIEFLLREVARKLFSQTQVGSLPTSLFRYSKSWRDKLNNELQTFNLSKGI